MSNALFILGWGMPGHTELLLLVLVLIVLFGAKRLPELARSLGRSITEFKRGKSEGEHELSDGEPGGAGDRPDDSSTS